MMPTNQIYQSNPSMLMDNLKSMMITMAMVKGTTQNNDDPKQGLFNTFLLIVMLSFIDGFVNQFKLFLSTVNSKIYTYVCSTTSDNSLLKMVENNVITKKQKISSVIVKIDNATKNPVPDAIIDILTNLPNTKCILLENNSYHINYSEEIKISNHIFAKLINSPNVSEDKFNTEFQNDTSTSTSTSTENTNTNSTTNTNTNTNNVVKEKYQYIDVYSYTLNMEQLREEINNISKKYLVKVTNKLGNNIYYFNEIPQQIYRDVTGQIDYSKLSSSLNFSMKIFTTNRSFKNLFGRNIDIIRNRVNFFINNKKWYDDKGVPYTLGIMASGVPGSGKTSLIKCLANETKRHIVNVHLSDSMTKTQIENLFYNEQISVTQNGKTEIYTIPISQRLYVLEDIDCQCEVIMDRNNITREQELVEENKKLKEQLEQLQQMMLNQSNRSHLGNRITAPTNDARKDIHNEKITLSFLLNIFDGILETPNRITIMTTNFIDKLDKAFTRPGRIDVVSKFGLSDSSQIIQMIEHRYDSKLTPEQIDIICNLSNCITPAETSRILFENFDNLNGAINELVDYSLQYMKEHDGNLINNKVEETGETEETGGDEETKEVENKKVSRIKKVKKSKDVVVETCIARDREYYKIDDLGYSKPLNTDLEVGMFIEEESEKESEEEGKPIEDFEDFEWKGINRTEEETKKMLDESAKIREINRTLVERYPIISKKDVNVTQQNQNVGEFMTTFDNLDGIKPYDPHNKFSSNVDWDK